MIVRFEGKVSSRSYAFGQWQLKQNWLSDGLGHGVQLPPKEYAVLCLLLEAKGEVLTKDELLDGVWQDGNVAEESLTRCIYSLRKMLGKDKGLIVSMYGRGYRFAVPVVAFSPLELVDLPLLAILPFRSNDAALCSELHEHAVRRLTRVFAHGLRILPASLTGEQDEDGLLRMLARLAPDYFLAGRCRTGGDAVQLSVELVRCVDHVIVHSEVLQADSIDSAVRCLAALVAQRVPGVRGGADSCSSYPLAVAYLNGLSALQAFTPDSLRLALAHFRQCIRLSTVYAPTWCAVADTWLGMAMLESVAQQQAFDEAYTAIGKALALEPDNETALVRLALLTSFHGSVEAAEALFRHSQFNADPMDACYHYAWHKWVCGDCSAALASIETCLSHDADSIPALILRLRILSAQGRDAAMTVACANLGSSLAGHPFLKALSLEPGIVEGSGSTQPADLQPPSPRSAMFGGLEAERSLLHFPVFWRHAQRFHSDQSDADQLHV